MIRHIVCWKLKEVENKAQVIGEIKNKLLALKGRIPELIEIEVGVNSPDASQENFDILLNTTFADIEALERYQVHSEHLAAGKYIKEQVESRAAVDYEF